MKRFIFAILLIFSGYLFSGISSCFATDEGGCLTCHRYPGLVRLEESGEFRVLHIDEAKYMSSPHGKIDCRKCHSKIVKVPHTGETDVDCTTTCHLEEKDKELVKNFPLSTIHKKEQSFITRLDDDTACRVCHPLYPHSENKLVRGLVNMHTGFMYCEVCHIKRAKLKNTSYDWADTENADFSGEPFGTYFNPRTRTAHKSEHYISRIGIFSKENGKKQVLMDSEDTLKAKEFLAKEERLKPDEKEKQLSYFHRIIEKKEISVACNECHSTKSILDFHQLGFDEKKKKNLMYLNVKGLVTKYKEFYFPHLFE